MRIVCSFLALFSMTAAHGSLPFVKVENFSASYAAPEGSAGARTFIYEDKDFGNNPEFEVYQQAGEFVLNAAGEEFRINSLPSAVFDWQSLAVENVNLSAGPGVFSLESQRVEYTDHEGKAGALSGLEVKCESLSKSDMLDSFLELCLNQKLYFFLPSFQGANFNSVNVWAENNKLNFSLKNGVWVKGEGAIFYEAGQKTVRIRVDKAKAGFFNVTGKLFAELKEKESDFMKVNRPWIEIALP